MKRFRKDKKMFVMLLTAIVFLSFVSPMTRDRGTETARVREGHRAHGQEEDTLPLSPGTSYYQYQWGLKNNGGIRRITSVYHSIRSDKNYVRPQGGAGDGEEAFPQTEHGETKETGPGVDQGIGGAFPGREENRSWDIHEQITDSIAGIDIGIEAAWAIYEQIPKRRMVTVAVIDTGVDTTHPELNNSVWVNTDEIPGDGIDNDNNGYIDDINGWNFYAGNNQIFVGEEDNHGTHGAGTIAGAWDGQGTTGIADGNYVKIMVLKVLGSQEGKGVSAGVKEAIRYAEDNGAQICNLSMGTLTYDEEMKQLIQDSSMLFVVSAGNGDAVGQGYNIDHLPMYPACYPSDNIITVGNLMFDGTLDKTSNYGVSNVDIAAPGTYILGPVSGGYSFMTGTSMAAPMVAGTAALVYSCRTEMSLMEVKDAILGSARPIESLKQKTATGGMLNAYGAVLYGQ